MSHFTVLVIGNGSLEDRMYPFEEQTDDKELLEFKVECTKQDAEQYRIDILEKYPDMQKEYWKIPIEEFMEKWGNYEFNEDEQAWGYWYNPNAKWDWYTEGGRWSGLLEDSDGFNNRNKLTKGELNGERFTTFAVLDEHDIWHEPGKMGWFGCSSANNEEEETWNKEYWSKFIEPLDDSTLLTLVDCHI